MWLEKLINNLLPGLLTWKYEDEEGNDNVNLSDVQNAVTEDALTKKRRLQNELTHALGVLGVKHQRSLSSCV